MTEKITVTSDGFWIGLAMIFIAFVGEPDLVDALIYFLMNQ